MPKSYKNQLLEKIADYRDQIKKIDIEISSLKNTKKSGFFNTIFGKQEDHSFEIQVLLNKKSEIQQWLGKLEEELEKDYVYGRRIFVKGTKYQEEGEIPFRKLAGVEDEDDYFWYEIVKTKNFELIPEPTNQVDPNAIKVMVEGYFVGYIDRRYNRGLKKYINNSDYIITGEVVGTGGSFDGRTTHPISYDIEIRIKKK